MDRPGTVADLLRFLITKLDDGEEGDGDDLQPLLLRLDGADVACAVDGVDLHVKPLDGHPAQVLAGFTAPPEWFSVGVRCRGWVHEPGMERQRTRVTSFVCRDGTELAAMRVVGGELRFMEGRGVGRVLDTLRRVLELPTDPPEVTVAEWLALCWLEIINRRAKRGRRAEKLTWRRAAALHPAIGLVGARPDELPTVGPRAAAALRWERFRQIQVAAGNDIAAWMDEGMFARQTVSAHPPLPELLHRANRRLTPEARQRVSATLSDWGLLPPAPAVYPTRA